MRAMYESNAAPAAVALVMSVLAAESGLASHGVFMRPSCCMSHVKWGNVTQLASSSVRIFGPIYMGTSISRQSGLLRIAL